MSTAEDVTAPPAVDRVPPGGAPPEGPTDEQLLLAYDVGCRSRVVEEHIVRLAARGEVKFAIWGPGEEVHGAATALALAQAVGPETFGIVPHYRSGALISMWCALHGYDGFARDVLRQQFSKDSDVMSRGRQMVNHLVLPDLGVLPVQSPVGMQLGKAAGYALAFKKLGTPGVTMGIVGDGTTAEGDMHDTMNAASVWDLPVIVMVTDNNIAISTRPGDGRGIKDFASYAAGFGVRFFTCDGRDFFDTWRVTLQAALYCRDECKPAFLHVHSLPRFNGHSSAADMSFDLTQDDPLIAFGQELVRRGLLTERDVLRRVEGARGRDFFNLHDLGQVAGRLDEEVQALFRAVRAEPDPPLDSVLEGIYAPFPDVVEPAPAGGTTNISYAAAIRSALDYIITERGGLLTGQDIGNLGGVMQATAGLKKRHPDLVIDAPLNEPLIVGTAMGAGLHPDVHALPEIQFGDYSLNAFHWLVHLGNLYWSTNGQASCKLTLRMPVDPFGGGAIYHSMSLDGYFSPIPGLVIVMPSTSWDVYGLLMTAAEYDGPVVFLEPKWMYRQTLGPAFPDEPQTREDIIALKKAVTRGEVPALDRDIRVPFGRALTRLDGEDLTIVSWGRAVYTSLAAAEALAAEGVSAEVIDLRTLVPPDLEHVYESVGRTGRLVVAAEDRAFAGFVRSIQGHVVERFPGCPTRAVGQKNVPGIAQNIKLEEATILTAEDVEAAARAVLDTEVAGGGRAGRSWVPPRYFIS